MNELFFDFESTLQSSYNSMKARVSLCVACPLALTRSKVVFGSGNIENPEIAFVASAPESIDEAANMPFSGHKWAFLKAFLAEREIIDRCFFTNALLCKTDLKPTLFDVNMCAQHLKAQLLLVKPRIIIILGQVAALTLQNKYTTHDAINLEKNMVWRNIRIFQTYHPEDEYENIESKILKNIEEYIKYKEEK